MILVSDVSRSIDNRLTTTLREFTELVRSGCELGCNSLNCKNSGHCSVAWRGNGDVACDCSRTSYAGSDCTAGELFASITCLLILRNVFFSIFLIVWNFCPKLQITASRSPPIHTSISTSNDFYRVTFWRPPNASRPYSSLLLHNRHLRTIKCWPWFISRTISKRLTTAVDGRSLLPRQSKQAVSVYFRVFEVILNKNGSVNVGIVDETGRGVVRTFVGNFSDGYRHFFVARFGAHKATAVTVGAYCFIPIIKSLFMGSITPVAESKGAGLVVVGVW